MNMNEERRPTPPQQHGHGHRTHIAHNHVPVPHAAAAPPTSSKPSTSTNTNQAPPGLPPSGAPKPTAKPPANLDYKLLVDPMLVKGAPNRLYRIAGNVPDQPSYPGVQVKDPRKTHAFDRFWKKEAIELQLPRFQIDTNYIGVPPPLQVTITNINDNVGKTFLSDVLLKYGAYEELEIFFHPVTKKHLGIAHILFITTRGAAFCIEKLHNTSMMGQVLNVFLDPFKKKCKELLEELTTEKKVEPPKKDVPEVTENKSKHVHGHAKEGHGHGHAHSKIPHKSDGDIKDHEKHHGHNSHGLHKSASFDSYPPASVYPSSSLPYAQPVPAPTSVPMIPHANAYFQADLHANSPPPPTAAVPSPYNNSNSIECDGSSSFPVPTENGISPDQQIDLDTRIKMMMSGGAGLGALFGGLDDEEGSPAAVARRSRLSLDKNDIWKASSDDEDDDPVEKSHLSKFKRNTFVPVDDEESRPPSPFLSTASYQTEVRIKTKRMQNGSALIKLEDLDEVSDDSDDDEDAYNSAGVGRKSRMRSETNGENLSDLPMPPSPSEYPLPPDMQAYYQQHGEGQPPYYPPTSDMQMPYDPYAAAGYPSAGWNGVDPSSFAAYYQNYSVAPPLPEGEDPNEAKPDLPDLTHEEVLEAVEDRLFTELKAIARRDCQKKLIEQCAFKVLESWVAERDRQHKESQANDRLQKLQSAGHAGGAGAEAQTSDIFGLGFRATIPRMPSFRKRRSPSRDRMHGSTDGEDDDHDRQRDEWRDDDSSRDSFEAQRQRRRSLSSVSSSSSASSSSEAEQSDEEDGSSVISSKSSSSLDERLVKRKDKGREEDQSDEGEASSDDEGTQKQPIFSSSDQEDEDMPATTKVKHKGATPTSPPSKKTKAKRLQSASPSPERVPDVEMIDIQSPDDLEQKETEHEPEKPAKTFELALAEITTMDHPYATLEAEPEPEPLPEPKRRGPKAKASALPDAKPEPQRIQFPPRTQEQMEKIIVDFLVEGIDQEDYAYIKRSYEVATSSMGGRDMEPFLNKVRWIEHPVTKVDHKAKIDSWNRVNKTGSCRTEGFYRYTSEEKMKQKQALIAKLGYEMRNKPASSISHSLHLQAGNKNQSIREARSNQRRLMTEFADNESELLKFNQLKFRKKDLRFARSYIHDWGLFAAEPIAADEMVIEYVGQVIRAPVSDCREKAYEKVGIMSSYLFRLDGDEGLVVDATRCGNLSRFINHSCSPNCIAKTITVEGQKKIVIYSKQDIAVDEEITYDYKFPLEDEKIKCLCGAPTCRGFLN